MLSLRSLLFSIFVFSFLVAICHGEICTVTPGPKGKDDAPAIVNAFRRCGQNGKVIFLNKTYHINSVMNTTALRNCEIDLQGTLLWSNDIDYWLKHSMSIGYQNQSTVWFLGGDNITFHGGGVGTFDGNGQAWYEFVKGVSNYPRRPMGLTIWRARNSVFKGLRFIKSQMWTMTIIHSKSILLEDIYVNSSSSTRRPARNTDGADTMFSDDITFRRWTVVNGDDGISVKANTTNTLIEDSVFYGLGFAIGSIGQYAGVFETIQNITFRNSVYKGRSQAAYIKTWTGKSKGYPPNGGGGGLGFIHNITVTNITIANGTAVFGINRCTHFTNGGEAGDCGTSQFQIHDVSISHIRGNISKDVIADLRCSAAAPCSRIGFDDVHVFNSATGNRSTRYKCDSVVDPKGTICARKKSQT
ncbi:pectin lyase-like protein [Trichodelitschia bisporula]|uniref:Pectin lyase-like protein n=1 Tax=Trichodelitschia bisporula TaxID=703511 RepID=A0A6G1HK13_9PEZI|nr:pectin lyase-like protein [Trichodelitschia bisporula]